jgi:SOS-response transcriptional repressors (recA-mediated autopeptidases)
MGYRSRSSITKLEKGINDLPQSKVEELAQALETTPAALLGLDAPCACPPGFEPLPTMVQVPLIGSIACGTPITAEQNIECYIGVPAAWHADFALTCHGDSMSPTICNGDIVCIRCQPEVEQGEIAAVRVGEEATLKHFHRQGDAVMLLADNAAVCPPMFYAGEQLSELHIEGKAVGLCRGL